MNSKCQTALQIGKEYSERLQQACYAYENLTGRHPGADGDFWNSPEIARLEDLASFWWGIAKINDPTFMFDGTAYLGEYDEEN